MHKNNLIQFVHSLVLLPLLTGTMPLTVVLPSQTSINSTSLGNVPVVLTQKQNIVAQGSLTYNKVADLEAKTLKLRAEAIDTYFKSYDMPLYGMGEYMVQAADKYDLDWRLLPAIAIRESTGGKYACLDNKYNTFGWDSCNVSFSSYEDAIDTVASNLGGKNPGTAKSYDGKDTREILLAYNPPSIVPRYSYQVMNIMDAIGEKDLTFSQAV